MGYETIKLSERRKEQRLPKHPFPHQREAFAAMNELFLASSNKARSGLLVLPTGSGKTFTAVDWICKKILSKNIKVLWLAHTFHLLDQAFETFSDLCYGIPEPREILNIRVVSSQESHSKAAYIRPEDDVLIMTSQTAISNYETDDLEPGGQKIKSAFYKFLEDNKEDQIFIVLDEAHHAPAYGCRNLLMSMKELLPQHQLLGLTATPSYTDERRRGWLEKIFEDKIIYEASAKDLQMQKILADPKYIDLKTNIPVELNDKQYRRITREHKDVPEDIVENLAKNQKRNNFILHEYLKNKNKYGKTIIFADRWFQCEYIKEKLEKNKIRVGVVYSKIDGSLPTVRERNSRSTNENKENIASFKRNELDVLINVKMLTEGTDVPDVKTVFITRKTTSAILMTQMIGRALRGEKAGGGKDKEFANIVLFADEWKHLIHWARYDLSGGLDESSPSSSSSYPKEYISIRLIQELAKQMEEGKAFQNRPYSEIIPLGWYETEYTNVADKELGDTTVVHGYVMIYDQTEKKFKNFIQHVEKNHSKEWQKEELSPEYLEEHTLKYIEKYFNTKEDNFGGTLENDLIRILRHIGQNDAVPRFISFDQREKYDLDKISKSYLNIPPVEADRELKLLFDKKENNLWKEWYKDYAAFKSAYNYSMERNIAIQNGDLSKDTRLTKTLLTRKEAQKDVFEQRELTEKEKEQVKNRDGNRCLCCGTERKLEIDHINPHKYTGLTTMDTSQTLCKYCNGIKGANHINFSHIESELRRPLDLCPIEPGTDDRRFYEKHDKRYSKPIYLETCLKRTINFFYRCQAVSSIDLSIRKDGDYYKKWLINLYPANNTKWLEKHNQELLRYVRQELEQKQVKKIEIT